MQALKKTLHLENPKAEAIITGDPRSPSREHGWKVPQLLSTVANFGSNVFVPGYNVLHAPGQDIESRITLNSCQPRHGCGRGGCRNCIKSVATPSSSKSPLRSLKILSARSIRKEKEIIGSRKRVIARPLSPEQDPSYEEVNQAGFPGRDACLHHPEHKSNGELVRMTSEESLVRIQLEGIREPPIPNNTSGYNQSLANQRDPPLNFDKDISNFTTIEVLQAPNQYAGSVGSLWKYEGTIVDDMVDSFFSDESMHPADTLRCKLIDSRDSCPSVRSEDMPDMDILPPSLSSSELAGGNGKPHHFREPTIEISSTALTADSGGSLSSFTKI